MAQSEQDSPGGSAPARPETPPRSGILSLIGNTPLVPICALNPNPNVEIYGKLEKTNPGGSVKDRIGLWMVEQAERSGELTKDKTILEATSGNTGIGLAMVAAAKGYRILLAMSEGVSVERRKILAAFGGEFLLTPADRGTDGAIERAYELAAEDPDRYYVPDQYNNPANVEAHYHTTALEIWEQTQGRITHFVTTMGTTGTLMGCTRRFRELNPNIRTIGVEPYLGHRIQGLKNLKEAYIPGIYDSKWHDEKVNIEDDDAYEMARRLAREEGLLVGMSSGAAMHVAYELAQRLDSGVIVVMLPDGGDRYLSTTLFQVSEPEAVSVKLNFFNTLTRRYEPFEPAGKENEATMYSCGPTVHRRPHLGLLRRMLVDDLIRRTLEFAGYEVKHVVSVTDLDDNTIQEAERLGESMADLCARHEAEFHEDCRALELKPAHVYARSSECVDEMVELARTLVQKRCAYEKLNSVYFDIGRVKSYGEISGIDLGKIRIGATVDLERYDKDDPRDFTLMRRSTLSEMRKGLFCKTEWGNVRPSWHIHCYAMSRMHLGDRFDIHTGSVDLVFPHHENELVQSRALTGEPQARYWLHSELVLVGSKKMSDAEGERITLPDLLARGYSPRELRFFLLQTHYRQPVHLTDERLEEARNSLQRLDELVANLAHVTGTGPHSVDVEGWIGEMKEEFHRALLNDMNVSAALAAMFSLARKINYLMSQGRLQREDAKAVLTALRGVDQVLAILPADEPPAELPADIAELVQRRDDARQAKDFELADRIRAELAGSGYITEDYATGTRVKRRN